MDEEADSGSGAPGLNFKVLLHYRCFTTGELYLPYLWQEYATVKGNVIRFLPCQGQGAPSSSLLPGHLASTSARPHAVCLKVSSPQAKGRGQRNPEVTSCRERLLISSCLSDILSRWQSVQLDPLHPTTGCGESSTLAPILCYVQIRAQPASCNAQCHCHSPWSFLAVLWQVSLLSFPLLGLSLGFSSLPCPPPCPCFFFLWSFSL